MPIYDYLCSSCGGKFEIFHSMKEADRTMCPHCNKPTLHKQISPCAGIIFKGSGFYETDYKHSSSCSCCDKKSSASCPHKA